MACKCEKKIPTTCMSCFYSWCDHCDGAHGPLCHKCHGRGYSTAPLETPREFRRLENVKRRRPKRKTTSERLESALDALEELTLRCDGDEGVRPDGSNMETARAHAVLTENNRG
jgi:hypothetical protein